jgi:hypothetical protein
MIHFVACKTRGSKVFQSLVYVQSSLEDTYVILQTSFVAQRIISFNLYFSETIIPYINTKFQNL